MPADANLAHVSDVLLVWAITAYALAMLGYAAEFAWGRRSASPRAQHDASSRAEHDASLRAQHDASLRAQHDAAPKAAAAGRTAVALTVLGWGTHVASVVTRGFAAHRVPWGNMYEFSSMVALIAVSVFLVMLTRSAVRFLGAFVMAPVVLYLGLAGTVLYAKAAPLVPALNSYWIKIHVVAAITATGAFMVSGVVTGLYLYKDRWEQRQRRTPGAEALSLGPGTAASTEFPAAGGGLARWLPASEVLDRLTYRIIVFGFPVWTFAIIAGAIWAESAWSRYWGWDPKETWSFITWLGYAAYLHARATAGWRGRRAAMVSLVAFGCLMVDYYVVNTVIVGMHSYAGT